LRCATRPATAIFAAARSSEPEGCVSGTSACEVYAREHAVGLAPPSLQTPTAATKLRERGWVRTVREVSKIGRGAARAPENFEREAQLRCRTGLRHRRHAIANVSLATPFVHIDLVRLLRAPPAKQCARSTSLPSTALAKLRVRCCADAAYSRSKFDRWRSAGGATSSWCRELRSLRCIALRPGSHIKHPASSSAPSARSIKAFLKAIDAALVCCALRRRKAA